MTLMHSRGKGRGRSVPPHIPVPAITLVALLALLSSPAVAEKTDVVVMDNGNVIVGEVKKMVRGLLEFSVDDISGRLQIEWEHVVRLTSNQQLDFELEDGSHYFGSLIESSADGELRIQTATGVVDVRLLDVILFEPIKSTFWKRLTGDLSAGISFTKATDIFQFNFGGTVRYRRRISLTLFQPNAIITSESEEESKTNATLPLTHLRFFKNKWFYRGDAVAGRNDELGIDFRGSLAGGLGRSLVQTNRGYLLVSGLLSGNREATSDGQTTTNVELAFDTLFEAYRYDTPKVQTSGHLIVFYNLTTQGRYRVAFDGRISLELVKDFYWDIGQLYYRYDSDPSATADSTDDYGILTGLRYKFN